jgi:hypothetical protein
MGFHTPVLIGRAYDGKADVTLFRHFRECSLYVTRNGGWRMFNDGDNDNNKEEDGRERAWQVVYTL